jgi:peroxiredoxin
VDFWATWCDPCRESFPSYQRLAVVFGDRLVVVGVSVDEEPDGIDDFKESTGVKFPLVWDKSGTVAKRYAPPKMPTSYVVDQDGVIRHIHAGYHQEEESTLKSEIQALLGS